MVEMRGKQGVEPRPVGGQVSVSPDGFGSAKICFRQPKFCLFPLSTAKIFNPPGRLHRSDSGVRCDGALAESGRGRWASACGGAAGLNLVVSAKAEQPAIVRPY